MTFEKRAQERVSLDTSARLFVKNPYGAHDQVEFETVIANLSGGGAFLKTETKLPLATKVDLEFSLSISDIKKLKLLLSVEALRSLKEEQVLIEASGVVIRQEEEGIAIIFDTNYQFTPMKTPA